MTTKYNGVTVKWFIGDWNTRVNTWEAWGSVEGKAYQLSAWFNRERQELYDIKVNSDEKNYYYDAVIYKKLTAE